MTDTSILLGGNCRCGRRRRRLGWAAAGSLAVIGLSAATNAFSCVDRVQAAYTWFEHQRTIADDLARAEQEKRDADAKVKNLETKVKALEVQVRNLKKKRSPQSLPASKDVCELPKPRKGLFGEMLGGVFGDPS